MCLRARLDDQLGALEGKLREADTHVQQLLGHSTALWLAEGGKQADAEHMTSNSRHPDANGEQSKAEQSSPEDLPMKSDKQRFGSC